MNQHTADMGIDQTGMVCPPRTAPMVRWVFARGCGADDGHDRPEQVTNALM
jgi:hypothetical protein